MTASPLEQLLWWSRRDLRFRYLRLLRSFEEFAVRATLQGRQVFQAARRWAEADLTALEQEYREFDTDGDGQPVDVYFRNNPAKSLRTALSKRRDYNTLERKIFPWLPLDPHPPEDLRFFLLRSMNQSLYSDRSLPRFALVYSGGPEWHADDISASGREPVQVIPIAFPESLTPLRWPLLVHELAHSLDPADGKPLETHRLEPVVTALDSIVPPEERANTHQLLNLARELFADYAAYSFCGASYLYAYTTEALFADRTTRNHMHLRRPLLHDAVTRLALLDDEGDRVASITSWMSVDEEADQSRLEEEDLNAVKEDITLTLKKRGLEARSAAEYARDAVAAFEPFNPAERRLRLPDDVLTDRAARDALRAALEQVLDPPSPVRATEVMDAVASDLHDSPVPAIPTSDGGTFKVHEPLSDGEILTAAWTGYYAESASEFPKESLLADDGKTLDDDRLRYYLDQVVRFDTNITRSMESSAVHRWLEAAQHE